MPCQIGNSYIIKAGDTLRQIAQQTLSNGDRWVEIRKSDGSTFTEEEAKHLQVGQEVCIPTQSPPPPSNNFVQRVVNLTNAERAQHGLQPLVWNDQLFNAAQEHSHDMAHGDYFDHRELVKRVREKGYPSSYVGENISAGNSTPEDAVNGWMNSPGHRANILKPEYGEIGVGYYFLENDPGRFQYKHYWTQIFGKR